MCQVKVPLWKTTQPFFLLAGCQIFSVGASAKCKLASFCRLCGSCSVFSLSGGFFFFFFGSALETSPGQQQLRGLRVRRRSGNPQKLACDVDGSGQEGSLVSVYRVMSAMWMLRDQRQPRIWAGHLRSCKCWDLIFGICFSFSMLPCDNAVLLVWSGLCRRNTWFCFGKDHVLVWITWFCCHKRSRCQKYLFLWPVTWMSSSEKWKMLIMTYI